VHFTRAQTFLTMAFCGKNDAAYRTAPRGTASGDNEAFGQ